MTSECEHCGAPIEFMPDKYAARCDECGKTTQFKLPKGYEYNKTDGGYSGKDTGRKRGDPLPDVVVESETSKVRRTAMVLGHELALEHICVHVANGGSLVQYAKENGVKYSDLAAWIREDDKRTAAYDQARDDRKEWSREQFLAAVHQVALSDIREIFHDDGTLKHPNEWPEGAAKCVQSIKVSELFEGTGRERMQVGEVKEVKMWDKVRALDMLGRVLKEYVEDDKTINVKLTLEKLVAGSWDKKKT